MSEQNQSAKLPPLNLPPHEMRIRSDGSGVKVFDPLRAKYVALTPEEYVRQQFVAYLTGSLHYPMSIMANEVSLTLNDTKRRADTVVFRTQGDPLVIIEYKAPDVNITQAVFDQIARYNMVLKARYLVVSNGIRHYCCAMDYANDTYHFIPKIPDYREIITDQSQN